MVKWWDGRASAVSAEGEKSAKRRSEDNSCRGELTVCPPQQATLILEESAVILIVPTAPTNKEPLALPALL